MRRLPVPGAQRRAKERKARRQRARARKQAIYASADVRVHLSGGEGFGLPKSERDRALNEFYGMKVGIDPVLRNEEWYLR